MLRCICTAGAWAALASSMAACAQSGVGDPCVPESVPGNGFLPSEAYLETSSVQCETRTCMVYKLDGDPRPTCIPGPDTHCARPEEIANSVYCTCRCDAAGGTDAHTCACPSGYACTPILQLGGPGVRGSYCVKSGSEHP